MTCCDKEENGKCRLEGLKPGLYIIEFSPPPGGGGKKIKGSGDGEENQRGKKGKKRKFEEIITFDSTK